MNMGMPSAILRKTLSCRFSPPAPAAPPCRRSRRPPSSRRGTATGAPLDAQVHDGDRGGNGQRVGGAVPEEAAFDLVGAGSEAHDAAAPRVRERRPAGRRAARTAATACRPRAGRGRGRGRRGRARENAATLSRDGQLETAGPEADGRSRHRGASSGLRRRREPKAPTSSADRERPAPETAGRRAGSRPGEGRRRPGRRGASV